jgi:hypothetical protein
MEIDRLATAKTDSIIVQRPREAGRPVRQSVRAGAGVHAASRLERSRAEGWSSGHVGDQALDQAVGGVGDGCGGGVGAGEHDQDCGDNPAGGVESVSRAGFGDQLKGVIALDADLTGRHLVACGPGDIVGQRCHCGERDRQFIRPNRIHAARDCKLDAIAGGQTDLRIPL